MIPKDASARLEVLVSDEMRVNFATHGPGHPVYATYWMAQHMEEVGRTLVLPYLEQGEVVIGHEVAVRHLASALPGMRVEITAKHDGTEGRRVVAVMRAVSELGDLIGEGTTTQVVLPAERLDGRLRDLRRRWQEVASR